MLFSQRSVETHSVFPHFQFTMCTRVHTHTPVPISHLEPTEHFYYDYFLKTGFTFLRERERESTQGVGAGGGADGKADSPVRKEPNTGA